MPNMANVTLKNAAGTDVTAVALSASAGDNTPAKWRVEDTSVPPLYRPYIEVKASANGNKEVRRVSGKVEMPYQVTVDGIPQAISKPAFAFEAVVSQLTSQAAVDDWVAYVTSFINSTLFKDTLKSQISPT